ncbi:hypothetical protein BBJ28_00007658 [Nothophytophthora sp. Chile5]|nr:hypothetical protein BBJ28_00007658 [Nothophytophthora sp. Chile5]
MDAKASPASEPTAAPAARVAPLSVSYDHDHDHDKSAAGAKSPVRSPSSVLKSPSAFEQKPLLMPKPMSL